MKNSTKFVLPSELVPEGAKLKNGEAMSTAKVGAFYGSSMEWNITGQLQICNGQLHDAPADTALQKALKPKRSKGQFGALREETTVVSYEDLHLGKCIYELATKEEIDPLAEKVEEMATATFVTDNLSYYDNSGNKISYEQLMQRFESHKVQNAQIQKQKDDLISAAGCNRRYKDGKWFSPEYPKELLDALAEQNELLYSPTGVNLVITISGSHTIAKQGNYYGGKLDQAQLDELAQRYNYKEAKAFWKGTVKRNRIVIPIQTVAQLKAIMKAFKEASLNNTDMSDAVKRSIVRLEKAKAENTSSSAMSEE